MRGEAVVMAGMVEMDRGLEESGGVRGCCGRQLVARKSRTSRDIKMPKEVIGWDEILFTLININIFINSHYKLRHFC